MLRLDELFDADEAWRYTGRQKPSAIAPRLDVSRSLLDNILEERLAIAGQEDLGRISACDGGRDDGA